MKDAGNERMIDFVYFDLGQVIIPVLRDSVAVALSRVSDLSLGRLKKIMRHGYTDKYRSFWDSVKAFDRGQIYPYEFYGQVKRRLRLTVGFKKFIKIWQMMLGLDDRFVRLIKALRAQGIRTGIISDLCIVHHDRFWQMMSREQFDITLFSFEYGVMKSDGDGVIFERAIQAANLPPSRVFFIDDRYVNVLAAVMCKLRVHYYENDFEVLEDHLRSLGVKI
ncbi:MAG: hypothetical protein COU51_02450 [Parcubacteria group bacterium CG10_big_fil_rev_8_21_14_0_10_36_14]|nr:MAG: hypothetical protein COU51_02450 [Parcubacteria group bacterium CG10_big_fil_rev_8_21_14_0_10_36_14]